MSTRSVGTRKMSKEAFNMTPLAGLTLLLMVVFGIFAGWLTGRVIAKNTAVAVDGLESGMDASSEWQDFIVDCDEGFYHVVLNASSALPDGFISLSLNGRPVGSAFIPDNGSPGELQRVVVRNVDFPACTNGTLRASFDEGGVDVASVEIKTGYENWAEEFSVPDDPALDSDSDGVSNLHEYMVGGDPLDAEDTGYRPVLRDEYQVVYALADDPRIQYEAMASVTSNSVDYNAANTSYVGSKPFGETMRVHLSVLEQACEMVTLDLDYIWETPQAN